MLNTLFLVLVDSTNNLYFINDRDSLKKIVKGIKLKEASKILDEFLFNKNE